MPAKKRKKSKKADRTPFFDDLSPQTKQAIGAVFFFFLAIFISLSLYDSAGMVGQWTDWVLTQLFGGGRYLAPIACGFYIYALMNPREDESTSTSKVIGIILLFLSLLGFLTLYQSGLGGFGGAILGVTLSYLFEPLAAGFLLAAVLVISIFLTFDIGLRLPFRKRDTADAEELEDVTIADHAASDEPADADEPVEEESTELDEAEEPATKPSLTDRLMKKKSGNEFAVPAYSGQYTAPPLSLLNKGKGRAKTGDVKASSNTIKQTLKNFGIEVEMDQVEIGPTVTRYALKPAQGVKIAKIVGLQRELELNLAAGTIRIEAPIPGKSLVGIEVPNTEKASIGLASLLSSPEFTDAPHPLLAALGKDITGGAHFANIARMPHGLIAGTTGSGKSVMIHNLIVSLLYRNSPEQLRLIMVDPKRVELTLYNGIPHLMTEVITDAKKALKALKWAVGEMERRYDILKDNRVQNLTTYHSKIYQPAKTEFESSKYEDPEEEAAAKTDLPDALPYIVIVMDELADLMHAYPRELEAAIVRLAQMSRAVGIHLLLATQRPSVNVITGTIKANIPTRLAMKVASQIDSRTIIDQPGAEKLLGQGDMLFSSDEYDKPLRLQSAFISGDELKKVVDFLKDQGELQELDSIDLEDVSVSGGEAAIYGDDLDDGDELLPEAKQVVIEAGKASTSFLQRRLRIGYSRAARLMDELEDMGVIGPADGAKPRAILATATAPDEGEAAGDDDGDDTPSDNNDDSNASNRPAFM